MSVLANLKAAPIGGQLFAHDTSRRDCAAISSLLDTYATRLLAQALRQRQYSSGFVQRTPLLRGWVNRALRHRRPVGTHHRFILVQHYENMGRAPSRVWWVALRGADRCLWRTPADGANAQKKWWRSSGRKARKATRAKRRRRGRFQKQRRFGRRCGYWSW
jgi:hypothetical protein